MERAEIEKMKNEVFEIYKEVEKRYLEKCRKLSELLKLFNIEYFDYHGGKTFLKYRIYNNNYIYMSSNLNDEVHVSAINELMAEENTKVKSFDWIVRRTRAILEFLESYENIYTNLYETLYKDLEQSNENLKHEYKKIKEELK